MEHIIHLRKGMAIIRLWHYTLLPYLPKSQLLAQKCECDLIWKDLANDKQTNHILINYMWSYHQADIEFFQYYSMLADEFERRGYNFNYSEYITKDYYRIHLHPFANHHDHQYLVQCFYNLQEKYIRGQKDFDYHTYVELSNFVRKEVNSYVK